MKDTSKPSDRPALKFSHLPLSQILSIHECSPEKQRLTIELFYEAGTVHVEQPSIVEGRIVGQHALIRTSRDDKGRGEGSVTGNTKVPYTSKR